MASKQFRYFLNICNIVTDSNCDRSVMVLTVEATQAKLDKLKALVCKLSLEYSQGEKPGTDDGSTTQEDYIEAGLVARGYKITWPLGNYTTVEA